MKTKGKIFKILDLLIVHIELKILKSWMNGGMEEFSCENEKEP